MTIDRNWSEEMILTRFQFLLKDGSIDVTYKSQEKKVN